MAQLQSTIKIYILAFYIVTDYRKFMDFVVRFNIKIMNNLNALLAKTQYMLISNDLEWKMDRKANKLFKQLLN